MIAFHKISVVHPTITPESSLGTKFLVRQQVYVIARDPICWAAFRKMTIESMIRAYSPSKLRSTSR